MSDGLQAVIGATIIVMAGLAGLALVDGVFGSVQSVGDDGQVTRQAALLDGADTWVKLDDGKGTGETIYETTGYAVNLTGADDSYVQSDSGVTIATDQNWTVSGWYYVDSDAASRNMSALSLNGRVIVTYNGSANQWEAWYYDEGSSDSYTVTVPTSGNESGNFTNIQVVANGTHLTIYRNLTQGTVANISTSSLSDAPVNATNWDGRLEEVRTFDRGLDSTNRSAVFNSPIEEQPDLDPTGRIMFDQPDKSSQLFLYTSADITQSNVTYSSGFAEEIVGGGDYAWDTAGPKIRPSSGGDLDGAPVAYATYEFSTPGIGSVVDGFADMMGLVAIVPILIIGVVIISRLQGV